MALPAGSFQASPVALGDTLYLSTAYARAVALDGATGRMLWNFDPDVTRWGPNSSSHSVYSHRGVAVWRDSVGRRVFLAARSRLWALDAGSGRPIPSFGRDGAADLASDLLWPVNPIEVNSTSPPAIWRDMVIVGSAIGDDIIYRGDPPGHVQAFDARSGKRLWRWDPIPPPGDPARASWGGDAAERTGHANVWSFITVDTARGLIYLPVSAASNDWYGGDRPGDNRWSESLVCLDARTGRQLWAQQLVHHGLWDYDPAAPPTLATVVINGIRRDIVAQAGKTGFLYVYDRVTGAPIWPIEERAVPASDVPGEHASATQPVPTWPAPFARQSLTLDEANDVLPEVHDSAVAFLQRYRLGGLFTPPSVQGTVLMPSWIGGAGWGATSLDPVHNVLYVKSSNIPILARLTPDTSGRARRGIGSPIPSRSCGQRAHRRSRLDIPAAARSLSRHQATVRHAHGDRSRDRRAAVAGDGGRSPGAGASSRVGAPDVPPMGVSGPSGGLTTAGGLIFLTGGGSQLLAIRATDGSLRWSFDLRREAMANPMTYRTRDGRQFVVVATGGGSDAVLRAFTLAPERD